MIFLCGHESWPWNLLALQRIREIDYYKNIPMVAVTAYAAELDKTEFLSKGFTHYISKPFTQKELHILLAGIFKN